MSDVPPNPADVPTRVSPAVEDRTERIDVVHTTTEPGPTPARPGFGGGWLILLGTTPELLRSDRLHGTAGGAIATVAIACGLALAFRLVLTRGLSGFLTAVPFALVALPGFAVHTKWSLLVSVAGLAVAAALSLRPGSRAVPV